MPAIIDKTKRWARRKMAAAFNRMQSAANAERVDARRRQLALIADIHPSCLVSHDSRIENAHGNPGHITVGPECAILGDLVLFPKTGNIRLGKKCLIGAQTRIWSAASVTLGDYVLISHDVNIHDTSGHSHDWGERRREMDQFLPVFQTSPQGDDLDAQPISIEDDVWIGANAMILRGVRIGRGAIIGAATLVTKDVLPYTIVAGNPMRTIRQLEQK